MSDDAVMDAWRDILARVEARAEAAERDPTAATLEGITPIHDSGGPIHSFSHRGMAPPRNEKAAWLRGVAMKMVPKAYRWQVQEMVGGGAALILLAHEPQDFMGGLPR